VPWIGVGMRPVLLAGSAKSCALSRGGRNTCTMGDSGGGEPMMSKSSSMSVSWEGPLV
jgi:hypothetical protein